MDQKIKRLRPKTKAEPTAPARKKTKLIYPYYLPPEMWCMIVAYLTEPKDRIHAMLTNHTHNLATQAEYLHEKIKQKCICWDEEKGCECKSRGYPYPCMCCKVHNKKLPAPALHHKNRRLEEYNSSVIWIQSSYPNRFFCTYLTSILPVIPYEMNYDRLWSPSGAIRANGQEILAAASDGYD